MTTYTEAHAQQTSRRDQEASSGTGFQGPVPRDARLVALILGSMGVLDVEPAVLLQLLEFAHRYTYDVLSDALVYADHANSRQSSTNLTLEDLNLAIQSRVNYSFTKPPEKDTLLSLATALNTTPLPPISDRHGVKLPPQQHCLTNPSFSIIPNPLPEDFFDHEEQQPQQESQQQQQQDSQTQQAPSSNDPSATLHNPTQSSAQDSTQPSSTGFDRNTQQEDDDYDNDEDDDVSMTTVQPSQPSQNQESSNGPTTADAQDEARGTKRSLDEDEDYD